MAILATQVWTHTYATDGISQDIADYLLRELSPAQFALAITDHLAQHWVAECNGHLVGFAVVKSQSACPVEGGSDTELKTLYVQEHFTRQGVGKLLLHAAKAQAQAQSSQALWLSVDATNDRALAFYARQGYRRIGTSYFVLGEVHYENHVLTGSPSIAG